MTTDPGLRSGSAATCALQVFPFILVGKFDGSHDPQGFAKRACNRKLRVVGGDLRVLRHAICAHLIDNGVQANFPTRECWVCVAKAGQSSPKLELGGRDFEVTIRVIITDVPINFHSESDARE